MKKTLPIAIVLSLSVGTAWADDEDAIVYPNAAGKTLYADYHDSHVAKRARQNWMLNCMGCHKVDGSGHGDDSMPDLRRQVATLLHAPGGREYLSRVPGITNTPLSDRHLAELIDWVLISFDPEHIPVDHRPYKPEEVGKWRKMPLTTNAAEYRAGLVNHLSSHGK